MFIIIALCDVQRMRERVCVCESVLAAGRCLYDIIYENIWAASNQLEFNSPSSVCASEKQMCNESRNELCIEWNTSLRLLPAIYILSVDCRGKENTHSDGFEIQHTIDETWQRRTLFLIVV